MGSLAQDDERVETRKRESIATEPAAESGGDKAVRADQVDEYLGRAPVHLWKLALEDRRGTNGSVQVAPHHRGYSTLVNYFELTMVGAESGLHLPHGRSFLGGADRLGAARGATRLIGLLHGRGVREGRLCRSCGPGARDQANHSRHGDRHLL